MVISYEGVAIGIQRNGATHFFFFFLERERKSMRECSGGGAEGERESFK